MKAYIDSSVLLRLVLREPLPLREWKSIKLGVVSQIARVECLRTLDTLRVIHGLDEDVIAIRRQAILEMLDHMETVEVDSTLLERAAQPIPTPLRTLGQRGL